jgi:drug/metabolite transporter superfamily protein YnfA
MRILSQSSVGTYSLLAIAALLEVLGDSCFQSAVHRSSGIGRAAFFTGGVAVLGFYGVIVNLPEWDFGKLLGAYVAFFFLAAQIVARVRFQQPLTLPVFVGGTLIVAGGAIISFWRV